MIGVIRSSKSAFLASVNYHSNLCLQVVHTSQIFNLNDLFTVSIISQFRELMFRIGFLWTCVANTFTCLRNKWICQHFTCLLLVTLRAWSGCSSSISLYYFPIHLRLNSIILFSSPKSHVSLRLPFHPFKCLTSWTINIARRIFKRLLYKINYSLSHVFVHCV